MRGWGVCGEGRGRRIAGGGERGCVDFVGDSCHDCFCVVERGYSFAGESGSARSHLVGVGGFVNRIEAGSAEGWSCSDGLFGALLDGAEETASESLSESLSESVILNLPWLLYFAC